VQRRVPVFNPQGAEECDGPDAAMADGIAIEESEVTRAVRKGRGGKAAHVLGQLLTMGGDSRIELSEGTNK
jgi:hypothetical protein